MAKWDFPPVTKKMVEATKKELANKQCEFLDFYGVSLINSLCLQKEEPFMVVNKNGIESAIGNQYQPYERMELAFASMYKSLILNHGFANGNKRTAVISLYIASLLLDNKLKISDEEFAKLTYKIASENGGLVSVEEIADATFSKKNSSNVDKYVSEVIDKVKKFISDHKWLMDELAK